MDKIINVDLVDDTFIHFTYQDRIKKITADGKLLMDSPSEFVGIAGVQAVSVQHGSHVPGVQYTRLQSRPDSNIVAIHFKTNTKPKIGYPEEVIWDKDVNLIKFKVLPISEAINMLERNNNEDEDYVLMYESFIEVLLR